jgi:hypothetical protein
MTIDLLANRVGANPRLIARFLVMSAVPGPPFQGLVQIKWKYGYKQTTFQNN